MAKKKNIVIEQGKSFSLPCRWEGKPIIYRPITSISQTAPVEIEALGHGAPAGWRCTVVSAKGMTQINASSPPKDDDYHPVTVLSNNSVSFNDVNAAGFSAYTGGGYLQFNTPIDLTGYTARMTIRDKVGGTELFSLTTENSRIIVDPVNFKITLVITATETAAFTWAKGVYDLEVVSATGVVTALMAGSITVTKEVTT